MRPRYQGAITLSAKSLHSLQPHPTLLHATILRAVRCSFPKPCCFLVSPVLPASSPAGINTSTAFSAQGLWLQPSPSCHHLPLPTKLTAALAVPALTQSSHHHRAQWRETGPGHTENPSLPSFPVGRWKFCCLSLNHSQTGHVLQLLEVSGCKPSSPSSWWEENNSPSGKSFASVGSRSRSLPPESWELGLWDITGPERQRDTAQTTGCWPLEILSLGFPCPVPIQAPAGTRCKIQTQPWQGGSSPPISQIIRSKGSFLLGKTLT